MDCRTDETVLIFFNFLLEASKPNGSVFLAAYYCNLSMSFWKPGSSSAAVAGAVTSSSVIVDEGGAGGAEVAPASQFNFSRNPLDLQRQALPIARHRRQILYAIEKYPVTIIVGETGSGKYVIINMRIVESFFFHVLFFAFVSNDTICCCCLSHSNL